MVALRLGLVNDLFGELLHYPFISGSWTILSLPLLYSDSRADDPYLIYGDDDHLVGLVSKFCYWEFDTCPGY
jgi:hypothetical protein